MQFTQHHLKVFAACVLTLISTACSAQESSTQSKPAQTKTPPAVSTEQIRAALTVPEEDVSETLLGKLIIRHSNGKTPGKIFLNGELIYTARVDEPMPYNRSGVESFDLQVVDGGYGGLGFDSNDKNGSERRITKMVVREESVTCQYRVLDFTGPKVWISEGFPKKAFEYHNNCNQMTYVTWPKKGKLKGFGLFYFGDEPYLWDKEGYHGNTAAYNPRLKAVFEDVDIPIPPHNDRLYYKRLEH